MDELAYRTAERKLWQSTGILPSERWVTVPSLGARVRIQEVGEGAPVLFLHPASSAGSGWAPVLPFVPGFRHILIDRPGTGLTPPLAIRGKLKAHVIELMRGILDALELERTHLIASSFGSYCALALASAFPERVGRMVHLSCPALVPGMKVTGPMRLLGVPLLNRWLIRLLPASRAGAEQSFGALGHSATIAAGRVPVEIWDWWISLVRDTDTLLNELAYNQRMLGIGGMNASAGISEEELAHIPAPNLFLWGGQDPLGSPTVAERLVSLMPDAKLQVFAQAGHLVWLDVPRAAGEAARAFLTESDSG